MLRLVVWSVCSLVAIGIVGAKMLAYGDANCGVLVNTTCPGCTAHNPADPDCYCGLEGEACNCLKDPGSRQTDKRVECNTADFDYNEDPNGWVMNEGAEKWCTKTYKCQSGGSGLNCAAYEGSCYPQGYPDCEWTLFSTTTLRTFVKGWVCIEGVPQPQ